jgi:hypothetical protein
MAILTNCIVSISYLRLSTNHCRRNAPHPDNISAEALVSGRVFNRNAIIRRMKEFLSYRGALIHPTFTECRFSDAFKTAQAQPRRKKPGVNLSTRSAAAISLHPTHR